MARPSARYIEELAQSWEPTMRAAFIAAVRDARQRANLTAIARLLENGDVEGAIRAVGLDPSAFSPLAIERARVFHEGGAATALQIPSRATEQGYRLSVLFDATNPRAERIVAENSLRLATELVDDQIAMMRTSLSEGLNAGRNPRSVALDLVGRINPATRVREGGTLGLHSTQERWLANYVSDLGSDDPATLRTLLDRGLRDKRFDRSIAKAIREGTGLPPEIQAKMRASYANRALKWRGDLIAKQETLSALREAQVEAWNQGIDKGVVKREEIRKFWVTAGDLRVRPEHQQIPGMNPDGRAWNEPFQTPTGTSMFAPHDHDLACRCRMNVRVNYVDRAVRALNAAA